MTIMVRRGFSNESDRAANCQVNDGSEHENTIRRGLARSRLFSSAHPAREAIAVLLFVCIFGGVGLVTVLGLVACV
jgi:hypothetical protein